MSREPEGAVNRTRPQAQRPLAVDLASHLRASIEKVLPEFLLRGPRAPLSLRFLLPVQRAPLESLSLPNPWIRVRPNLCDLCHLDLKSPSESPSTPGSAPRAPRLATPPEPNHSKTTELPDFPPDGGGGGRQPAARGVRGAPAGRRGARAASRRFSLRPGARRQCPAGCWGTCPLLPLQGQDAGGGDGHPKHLNAGEVVIGDGGFVFALEKRGYVKAGPWTPEAAVEHPEAVRQLHREFLRAGSNVMQTFTFYASEDKLENRGNYVAEKISGQKVNEAACDIAWQVANEGDALVAGGVSQTPSYLSCKSEREVKKIFHQQLEVFVKKNVDFLIAEYFEHVEEAVWAVETLKTSGKPVAATMCIGPEGDLHGVPPGECTVRPVRAGAAIVGVNCHFDPTISLQTVKLMKEGLEAAQLKAHLMSQPLAYHTPDCGKQGFIDLPEFPFGLEPRVATRWDIQKYAQEAYNLGVRYIGGCCGFEPYHIRAIAEELAPERGFLPPASEKHGSWGSGLDMHTKPWIRARAQKEYWQNLRIASGRPYNPSMSKPDAWGVTKGTAELMQQKEATTEQQLRELFEKQKFKSAQ